LRRAFGRHELDELCALIGGAGLRALRDQAFAILLGGERLRACVFVVIATGDGGKRDRYDAEVLI
jgi:hypothetical protein